MPYPHSRYPAGEALRLRRRPETDEKEASTHPRPCGPWDCRHRGGRQRPGGPGAAGRRRRSPERTASPTSQPARTPRTMTATARSTAPIPAAPGRPTATSWTRRLLPRPRPPPGGGGSGGGGGGGRGRLCGSAGGGGYVGGGGGAGPGGPSASGGHGAAARATATAGRTLPMTGTSLLSRRRAPPTASPPRPTRPSRSPTSAPPRSAFRASSSTSSRSRPSCSRSTRPAAPSTGSPGRCWPGSTGSRPPSAPTSTSPPPGRSAGCSSSPRPGRRTGWTPTEITARIPTTRSTRSAPRRATCGRPAAPRTCGPRSSPTTTPTGTWTRCCSTPASTGRLPEDLVGSLVGLTHGARFPVAAKARYADDISERQAAKRAKPRKRLVGQRRRRRHQLADPARDQHLLPQGRARGRRQRRHHQAGRSQLEARQLHRAPGHLRQPVHLRSARPRLEGLSRAEAAQALVLRLQARDPEEGQGTHPARDPRASRRPPRPATAP